MKTILILLHFTAILILISCVENPVDIYVNNCDEFMPLHIGNYWIYSTYDSLNHSSHIDSLLITKDTLIESSLAYQLVVFRDGYPIDTGYFKSNSSSVDMYGKALAPLLSLIPDDCWTAQRDKWFSILKNKNSWTFKDSINGDEYSFLIDDPSQPGGIGIITSQTMWYLNIYAENPLDHSNPNVDWRTDEANINFTGNRLFHLLNPLAKFENQFGYQYYDDNRTMVADEFSLNVCFNEHIGIYETYEKLISGPNIQINRKRKLIRYNVY